MISAVLIVLLMIAVAKVVYWKLCFQGVLLYIAECGRPLPNTALIKRYAEKAAMKSLHITKD